MIPMPFSTANGKVNSKAADRQYLLMFEKYQNALDWIAYRASVPSPL